jgi:hypothetical protein
VISNPWKVFNSAAADEYDAVFLEVMTFSGNVGNDFLAIRKAHPSDFTQSGIRLFGRLCLNLKAYTSALRTLLQGRGLASFYLVCSACFNELIICGHECRLLQNTVVR